MKNKKRIIALVVVIAFLFVLLVPILGIFGGSGDATIELKVADGDGVSAIARKLKLAGVIKSEVAFKAISRLCGNPVYQKGIHKLTQTMNYFDVIKKLQEVPMDGREVLLTEGMDIRQIADKLQKEGVANAEKFLEEAQDGNFDFEFVKNIPQRDNRLEGYLYPDTYFLSGTESEHDIIVMMLDNFDKKVMPVYKESGTDWSLDDIIKLASIVEKESAENDDRSMIASVFVNRLNMGKNLQSDATVQYTFNDKKEDISVKDTQTDTPYNTYLYPGLPIGPICEPGIESIKAAIYPAESEYLYFIAVKDKSHSLFSKTFEEHLEKQRAIQNGSD